jgi:hypothetical protein
MSSRPRNDCSHFAFEDPTDGQVPYVDLQGEAGAFLNERQVPGSAIGVLSDDKGREGEGVKLGGESTNFGNRFQQFLCGLRCYRVKK